MVQRLVSEQLNLLECIVDGASSYWVKEEEEEAKLSVGISKQIKNRVTNFHFYQNHVGINLHPDAPDLFAIQGGFSQKTVAHKFPIFASLLAIIMSPAKISE